MPIGDSSAATGPRIRHQVEATMSRTSTKVLMLSNFVYSKKAQPRLAETCDLIVADEDDRDQFMASCKAGKYDGALVMIKTYSGSARVAGPKGADPEWLDALPKSIRCIVQVSAGYDDCDVPEMTKRGIWLCNSTIATGTADICMFLILAVFRNTFAGQRQVIAGGFREHMTFEEFGNDPRGHTLGILGFGHIGRDVATRARAFGMKIIYNKRTRLSVEEEEKLHITYATFEELIQTSDCISVHIPLSKESRHLLSQREFDLMKPRVRIVNTARGAVIDEEALMAALKSGKVFAAGLDVFEYEPHIPEFLRNHPRVTALPHIGGGSWETLEECEMQAADNCDAFVKTSKPLTPVNQPNPAKWC
ncbi:hypothetical protein SeMB42_g04307 [Synchytrium endobioticum]|uniref:D-isomer specific 2-hydroxyacid dehydrogenase NAD-binding domain-containing protein n=1 Tax=Synchytrium endobioticum TaxID=286115 RepID=A0A507D226_9FUNG|nr:hypothetical protein SeMB42_g04307 [Synchytrium endobioticum]TPX45355.1 hypothetical protein SeLEV6574_g03913 [Synchytrium endobioticum]